MRTSWGGRRVGGTQLVFYVNRVLSQAGQGIFLAGMLAVLLGGGHGHVGAGISSVFVAMMAASLTCGWAAGALIDRIGGPRALLFGAIGRCLVIGLSLLLPAGAVSLAIVAFGYSAISQLFSPAELALVSVISKDRPARMHAMLTALQYGGKAVGVAVLAPIAAYFGGARMVVELAFVMYLPVIGLVALLAVIVPSSGVVAKSVRESFSFRGPIRYFLRGSSAGYAGLLLSFSELASKGMFVAFPVYLRDELALGHSAQLALIAPAGVGIIAGLFLGRRLNAHIAMPVLRLSLISSVLALIALAYLGPVLAAIARQSDMSIVNFFGSARLVSAMIVTPVGLLLGLSFTITSISGRTILSSTAPAGQHGRVFAMQGMFSDLVCILPLALSGVSTEAAGARMTFLFIGAIGIALTVALELLKLGRQRPVLHPEPVVIEAV